MCFYKKSVTDLPTFHSRALKTGKLQPAWCSLNLSGILIAIRARAATRQTARTNGSVFVTLDQDKRSATALRYDVENQTYPFERRVAELRVTM